MCGCFSNRVPLQPVKTSSNFPLIESNTWLNNRYRLLKLLGQGGFGKTFLAVDNRCDSPSFCVIKQFFFSDRNSTHQKALELFRQEAFRLAELGEHPQIPQLLDTFEQDGQLFIVQEWIDGWTLEEELVEGEFNEQEIRQLLQELLPVLQYIHDRQIVHRDIKPANIIRRRSDRQLVLVDFGAAKYLDTTCTILLTQRYANDTGTLIGSAEYAAPEQIRGQADFTSDLYSLGVTCLHLLTQMSPFDLYDSSENFWKWREYLTEPLSPSFEKILCKLLQSAMRRRYQSAAEVLKDLDALSAQLNDSPIQTKQAIDMSGIQVAISESNIPTDQTHFKESFQSDLVSVINPLLADRSITSATVYDPPTQTWCRLTAKTEASGFACKVALFLGSRLAAAAATPPVKETISQTKPCKSFCKPRKRNSVNQQLQTYFSKLFNAEMKETIKLVFSIMSIYILTGIGAMTTICFFFEMERRSGLHPDLVSPDRPHHKQKFSDRLSNL